MSLSEGPFLYDIMGGAFKIWLSNGCCYIKYQFLVRISVRFGTAGWYCVSKGKILFFFSLEEGLCLFLKFHLCEFAVNKVLQIATLH